MANKVYYNKPQLRSYLVEAFEEYAIWGRGTGKTEGRIAPRTTKCVFQMPRSMGVFVAATYQQILLRTLPGVILGLDRLGYVRNRDYFVNAFAPAKWKWDLPHRPPLKSDNFIHWRNGSGITLVSQDRPGSANGLSIDWIMGDEAKLLKQEAFEQELLPANRGNNSLYNKSPLHHSILLTTDMPTGNKSRWIINKEHEMTHDKVHDILAIQMEVMRQNKQLKLAKTDAAMKRIIGSINRMEALCNQIRKGNPEMYARTGNPVHKPTIFFSEASTLENIQVLGIAYLDQQRRNLPEFIYRTAILNQRPNQVTDGFYPDLDEETHGYDSYHETYLQTMNYDLEKIAEVDCRKDADIDTDLPLDLAPDYGGSFNCIVVGQMVGDEYRFVNAMHVKPPEKIRDLVRQFKRYYRHHKRKEVSFFYDHTGKNTDPIRTVHYYQEYQRELSAHDEYGAWKVNLVSCGVAPSHEARHEYWSRLLKGLDPDLPRFRYNKTNCEFWAVSCFMAPMKQGRFGFEKDKKSERPTSTGSYITPQEEATHYSDAGDTLAYFRLRMRNQRHSVPVISMIR